MKRILVVLFVVSLNFALSDVGKPNTFSPNTTASSSLVNANFDSAFNSINHARDTLVDKFVRHDSLNSIYTYSTFGCTLTGVTTTVTGTANYIKLGNFTFVNFPIMTGTSNSGSMSVKGLPSAISPSTNQSGVCTVIDTGYIFFGQYNISVGGSSVLFSRQTSMLGILPADFQSSGTKGISGLNTGSGNSRINLMWYLK
jgi:hypothetical protein